MEFLDSKTTLTWTGHEKQSPVCTVGFSPDGRTLVSTTMNGSISLWDVRSHHIRTHLQGVQGTRRTESVAFSPDGRTLASASRDRTVRLWDMRTGTCSGFLVGHSLRVTSVSYHPSEGTLASASLDNTVRLWNTSDGSCESVLGELSLEGTIVGGIMELWNHGSLVLGAPKEERGLLCVAYSPDGARQAAGSAEKLARVWASPGAHAKEHASAQHPSNLDACGTRASNGTPLYKIHEVLSALEATGCKPLPGYPCPVTKCKFRGVKVAVKMSSTLKEVSLLRREMHILEILKCHPHVLLLLGASTVRFSGSPVAGNRLALVYERLSGGTLHKRLQQGQASEGRSTKGPLSVGDRLQIAREVATALVAMGRCVPPVVHRALRPKSILFDDSGAAKVAGWGFAKQMPLVHEADEEEEEEEEMVLEHVSGFSGCLAPEAALLDNHWTPSFDMYAFGVLLLQLLMGPRTGAQVKEVLSAEAQSLEDHSPPGSGTGSKDDSKDDSKDGSKEGSKDASKELTAWKGSQGEDSSGDGSVSSVGSKLLQSVLLRLDPAAAPWPRAIARQAVSLALQCTGEAHRRPPAEHVLSVLSRLENEGRLLKER